VARPSRREGCLALSGQLVEPFAPPPSFGGGFAHFRHDETLVLQAIKSDVNTLALELPVTTVLMLRAIAEIARKHGEDLSSLEARLNGIAVLGLGVEKVGVDSGYYAARAALGRVTADASNLIVERGVVAGAAPAVNAMAGAVAPRFGLVVSERAAASALPALPALGGATLKCCSCAISNARRTATSPSGGSNASVAMKPCRRITARCASPPLRDERDARLHDGLAAAPGRADQPADRRGSWKGVI